MARGELTCRLGRPKTMETTVRAALRGPGPASQELFLRSVRAPTLPESDCGRIEAQVAYGFEGLGDYR